MLATLGLDMPIKTLALAVEVTEASQREFIMAFDGAVTAPIAWVARRASRSPERRQRSGMAILAASPGRPHSTSGVICFDHGFRRSCRA